mgnify:CR=1 FL=1
MIGKIPTGRLGLSEISAVSHQGLTVKAKDGRAARLAVIDEEGNVIEAGPAVAREAFNVSIACYKQFLIGQGHLRVFSSHD